jgi:hypothetical protein
MNKRQPGEAVLRDGLSGEEAAARAINAEPWEPLPGMVKARCPECRYFFAAPVAATAALPRLYGGVTGDRNPTYYNVPMGDTGCRLTVTVLPQSSVSRGWRIGGRRRFDWSWPQPSYGARCRCGTILRHSPHGCSSGATTSLLVRLRLFGRPMRWTGDPIRQAGFVVADRIKDEVGLIRPAEVGAFEMRAEEKGASEMRLDENGAFEMRAEELGAFEMRGAEVGAFEMRLDETRAFEMRGAEIGAFEMRLVEVGAFEMRGAEVGAFEMRAAKVGAAKVSRVQIELPASPFLT